MGFLDQFLSLFGLGGGAKFAKFDPDDVHGFVRAKQAIEDAEREDDEDALATLLAKYGLKDTEELEDVSTSFTERHRTNPDMLFAEALISHEEGIAQCAESGHPIPDTFLQPVEGVTLHQFALIVATLEAAQQTGQDIGGALARFDMDEAAYRRVDQEWRARMSSSEGTFTANILGGSFQTFHLMAQSWVSNGHALY